MTLTRLGFSQIGRTDPDVAVEYRVDVTDHPVETNALMDSVIEKEDRVIDLGPGHDPDTGEEDRVAHCSLDDAAVVGHGIVQAAVCADLHRLPVGDIAMGQIGADPPGLEIDLGFWSEQIH